MKSHVELLLQQIAELKRECKLCGKTLYFVRSRESQQIVAYTAEAVPHIQNCKGLQPEQSSLLDINPFPD